MISLAGLNPEQREAASIIEGPLLLLAGAGSGKTRTITYRIAHMVSNCQIPSNQILAVSFTNKAAMEMKERVSSLLGKHKARGLTLCTFHSLGLRILKEQIKKLGYNESFSIYDTSDQVAIIREAMKNYSADKKKYDHKVILSKIGWLKNNGIREDEFSATPYFDPENDYDIATEYAYRFYQEKLKFYSAIDFDDILFLCVRLFKENPEVAEEYSRRFQYIMIDEYQDTNGLQFQMVLGLTSTHKNLCVVGDDDQAIYSFRGADIRNILTFEKHFPGAKVIKLEQNYRSTKPILELANSVIGQNKNRHDKKMWGTKESADLPLLWIMGDTDHEAQVVVEDIVQYQGKGGFLGEVAILYRSNTQTQPIEDELRISQVPYTIVGGQKFYEKKEVKDLIAYMATVLNPKDQVSIRRILNVPNRGIGLATLEKFIEISEKQNISLFEAMDKNPDIDPRREQHVREFVGLIKKYQYEFNLHPLPQVIMKMIEEINYFNFIEKEYDNPKQVERRKTDVMTFVESAERFTRIHKNMANLRHFVEKLLLQDAQDRQIGDDDDVDVKKNQVTLMTLHGSKGLEFDRVYFIGVEEEILPHKKTIKEGQGLDEERRLCYVGITRAREKLIMTYCKERELYGKKVPRFRSRFINELEPYFKEQDRTTFGHMSEDEAKEYKSNFFSDLLSRLE
ncbi:MAG: UvrD-helicase domain-containing protein [Bdellovibrio sp.]